MNNKLEIHLLLKLSSIALFVSHGIQDSVSFANRLCGIALKYPNNSHESNLLGFLGLGLGFCGIIFTLVMTHNLYRIFFRGDSAK